MKYYVMLAIPFFIFSPFLYAFDSSSIKPPPATAVPVTAGTIVTANTTWTVMCDSTNATNHGGGVGCCCQTPAKVCPSGTSPSLIVGVVGAQNTGSHSIKQIIIQPSNPAMIVNNGAKHVHLFVNAAYTATYDSKHYPVTIKYTIICSPTYGYPPYSGYIGCNTPCPT